MQNRAGGSLHVASALINVISWPEPKHTWVPWSGLKEPWTWVEGVEGSDVTDCISGRIAPRKPGAGAITGAMLFHDEEIDSTPPHFWPFNKKKKLQLSQLV